MNKIEKIMDKLPAILRKSNEENRKMQQSSKDKKKNIIPICLVLIIVMGTMIVFLFNGTIKKGADELFDKYKKTYQTEKQEAHKKQYKKYYEKAKNKYLVSNRVAISIGNLQEKADLEVLEVNHIAYIIEGSEDNKNKITSWLEVPGKGMYVVNLQAAEFIVDNERAYVHVRVPYPQLTNITIDYANVEKLLFKNDLLNDSYKVGEELAQRQLSSADVLIKKEFTSNQHFFHSAQKAAIGTIECLVKQLNPGAPELTVDVEFY